MPKNPEHADESTPESDVDLSSPPEETGFVVREPTPSDQDVRVGGDAASPDESDAAFGGCTNADDESQADLGGDRFDDDQVTGADLGGTTQTDDDTDDPPVNCGVDAAEAKVQECDLSTKVDTPLGNGSKQLTDGRDQGPTDENPDDASELRRIEWSDATRSAAVSDESLRDFMSAAERRDANAMSDAVETGDFSTEPNKAVCWTGYHERNQDRAMKDASVDGAKTIEGTVMGRAMTEAKLNDADSGLTDKARYSLWTEASGRFADGASGVVRVYESSNPSNPDAEALSQSRADGTTRDLHAAELPRLMDNPKVTNILSDTPSRQSDGGLTDEELRTIDRERQRMRGEM